MSTQANRRRAASFISDNGEKNIRKSPRIK